MVAAVARRLGRVNAALENGEVPPPELVYATSNRLSALTCKSCKRALRKHPQLWNQLRCADIEVGTAATMTELAVEHTLDEWKKAQRTERRKSAG